MTKAARIITASLAVVVAAGCSTTIATKESPATAKAKVNASIAEKPITVGKVMETMDSGGYTYVRLEKDGKSAWYAIPVCEVKAGQDLEVNAGMAMGKFTSSTLNRTFDNIIFSSGVAKNKQ